MQNLLEIAGPVPWYVPWIAGIFGLILALFLGRFAVLQIRRQLLARPLEDTLTIVAATIATGVSAQGMWRFAGDVLGLDGPLRIVLFAFIEVAIITSAVRARRNMREKFSAGVDGMAVWALTCLTAVLSSMDASSIPEAVFRLAAPLVAAWLWERGMAIERHRIRGTSGIHWRFTLERVLVRLGLAEATDRTAGDVDRQRRITRVALAVVKVDDHRTSGASERKQRSALARFRARIAQAVEHADLASDEGQQQALLNQIDTLRSADALINRQQIARWANPVNQEHKRQAEVAVADLQRLDSAEATQRALDQAALTLMALTERATSNQVTQRVIKEVTDEVIFVPETWTPSASNVTPTVTPVVTVERVTNEVTFDVTNTDLYDLERLLSEDPSVTPMVTPTVTPNGVTNPVTDDADEATKTKVMRAFWDCEIKEKRYPRPIDLARHADVDRSLASRLRAEWVDELTGWEKRRAKQTARDKASA